MERGRKRKRELGKSSIDVVVGVMALGRNDHVGLVLHNWLLS